MARAKSQEETGLTNVIRGVDLEKRLAVTTLVVNDRAVGQAALDATRDVAQALSNLGRVTLRHAEESHARSTRHDDDKPRMQALPSVQQLDRPIQVASP